MKDFIPRTVEERIIHAMARALWAGKYADAWDNKELPAGSDFANNGEAWENHCGDIPVRAYMAAAVFAEDILQAARQQAKPQHIQCLWQVFGRAMAEEGETDDWNHYDKIEPLTEQADRFGGDLAMESMGTGVGWADDHEDLPFEVPNTLEHLSWEDLKD